MGQAVLSNDGPYTTFSHGERTITFLTSKDLDRYLQVKEWDNGYLVVTARYHSQPDQEEFIDLLPILQNLNMDSEQFLSSITDVVIQKKDDLSQ